MVGALCAFYLHDLTKRCVARIVAVVDCLHAAHALQKTTALDIVGTDRRCANRASLAALRGGSGRWRCKGELLTVVLDHRNAAEEH